MSLSLDSLPVEIILSILLETGDLATLCNLLHASPLAWRPFTENRPASITEAVLTSGYTCQQIQFMFRFCALFRSREVPFWDHFHLASKLYTEPMQSTPATDAYEPEPLTRDIQPTVIRGLLITARDIHNISFDCLADCLRRFGSLSPCQLADEDSAALPTSVSCQPSSRKTTTPQALADQAARECQPGTQNVEATDICPPTWIEEQRVMRAFWRLQLTWDADENNIIRPLPPGSMMEIWWSMYYVAIHRPINMFKVPDNTAAHCYDETTPAVYTARMHSPQDAPPSTPGPEYQDIISVVDYVEARFGRLAADDLAIKQTYVTELLRGESTTRQRDTTSGDRNRSEDWMYGPRPMPTSSDEEALLQPSAAVKRSFQRPSRDEQRRPSLLECVGLVPFMRYGVTFWCDERMQGYGLAAPQEEDDSPLRDRIDWAWLSLLTPEELALAREKHASLEEKQS